MDFLRNNKDKPRVLLVEDNPGDIRLTQEALKENKMDIHDLHATILHLLGFDHTKLTYRYNGREFRLTDVFGTVAKPVVA